MFAFSALGRAHTQNIISYFKERVGAGWRGAVIVFDYSETLFKKDQAQ